MKRNLSIILAGIMACTLFTACGKETANTDAAETASVVADTTESTETTSEDSASTEDAAEFTIDFDNLETMTLGEITASDYVTLGEYTGVTAEATLAEVTDQDVEDYLANIKASVPPMVEVTDRAVEDGDTVDIDYVGKYADTLEAFDGGTAEGASLVIGSGSYIDGFESGLIGVNIGETVDLDLTFPEDYGATDLAGKAVVFTVTVNGISVEADEVTDEWAAGLGIEDVSSLDELRAYAKETLEEEAQENYDSVVESAVLQAVYDNSTFTSMPEKLVNRYMQQQYQMMQYRATMYAYYYGYSLTAADLASMYMQNEGFDGTIDDYIRSISEDMTQQYVMFQAIADEQNITISDEDIDEYLKSAYESASSTAFSSYEEYKASLDLEVYREGLMAEAVVDYLIENANVVEAAE